jgi:hypothetical protein
MARKLRVQYPGAVYHVMNRGDRQEDIFQSEKLARLGWGLEELERRRKGDPQKVLIAAGLRRETTMTLTWIADRLRMGAPGHVAHLLYWQGRQEVACENTLF